MNKNLNKYIPYISNIKPLTGRTKVEYSTNWDVGNSGNTNQRELRNKGQQKKRSNIQLYFPKERKNKRKPILPEKKVDNKSLYTRQYRYR